MNELIRRRASRRRFLGSMAAGGAALGATLAVGCGDDDDAQQPVASGASAEPKRGGTIMFSLSSTEQPSHDPHMISTTGFHTRGSGVVYPRLMRLKFGPDVK